MTNKIATTSVEKRTFDGFLIGLVQFLTHLAYSILLVPLFISYWGVEKYSIWLLILAFVTIMKTIDMGHQNYIGNEFNKVFNVNKEEAVRIIRSSTWIAFAIGALELIIFLVIDRLGLTSKFTGIIDPHFLEQSKWGILTFLAVWWLLGSVGGILARAILTLGYYTRTVIFGIILKLIEITVILIAIANDFSVLNLCIWISITNFIYCLGILWHIKRLFPEVYPLWEGTDLKLGFRNFSKSILVTISGAIEQINSNGLVILLSKYVTTTIVPSFTTLRTLTNTFMQPLVLMLGPLSPEIIRYHMQRDGDKIQQIIFINWLLNILFVNIPLIILSPFISAIYNLWTRGALIFDDQMFWLLMLWVLLTNYSRTMVVYLTGINNLKANLVITITRLLLTFGIAYLLIHQLGWVAVGIALVSTEIICSLMMPLVFVNNELSKIKGGIRMNDALLGGLPILVIILLGIGTMAEYNVILLSMAAFMITIFLGWLQWVRINSEVRLRVINLIRVKISGK